MRSLNGISEKLINSKIWKSKSWFYIKCVTFGVVHAFARTEYKVLVAGYRFLHSKMTYLQSCYQLPFSYFTNSKRWIAKHLRKVIDIFDVSNLSNIITSQSGIQMSMFNIIVFHLAIKSGNQFLFNTK